MPWLFLSAAILLEVAGITAMKLSRGFAEPVPSLAVLGVLCACRPAAVILALKRLDLSVTYAIWSGVGTALAALIGVVYFREPLTPLKLASLALGGPGRRRALARRQANALTRARFPANIGAWTVSSARATASSGFAIFAGVFLVDGADRARCGRSASSSSRSGSAGSPISASARRARSLLRLMAMLAVPVAAIAAAFYAQAHGIGLLNNVAWPAWIKIVVALLALDLAIWAQHLASHKVPLFWRLHQVHHADRDIDVTTAVRFHPVEIGLSMVWKIVVVVPLGAAPLAVFLFEVILNACAMFNHANIALPAWLDRVLRLFVVTPDMHRVHHSVLRREHDSNYGFNLSVWDRLFRTYTAQPRSRPSRHDHRAHALSERSADAVRLVAAVAVSGSRNREPGNRNRGERRERL